jgi:hypothetical protein
LRSLLVLAFALDLVDQALLVAGHSDVGFRLLTLEPFDSVAHYVGLGEA